MGPNRKARTSTPPPAPARETTPTQQQGGRFVNGVRVPDDEEQGRDLEHVTRRTTKPGAE